MPAKFNFLDRRAAATTAAVDLRQQFPKRSASWINARAAQIANDVTTELRAPARARKAPERRNA